METLISIILPVFNGEAYVGDAIKSVISQTHARWELLVVNDGSTDRTKDVVHAFSDVRIRYFEHQNKGVSASRNVGLENMRGDFFCFLDADDLLPSNSLKARFDIFRINPAVEFVDGRVEIETLSTGVLLRTYLPVYRGNPFRKLLKISSECFFGSTWMIRRRPDYPYRMNGSLTHCEDFLFFLELAQREGLYDFTTECILRCRKRSDSAMSNLTGLDKGYRQVFKIIQSWPQVTVGDKLFYWMKSRKIMFLSYFFNQKSPRKAFLSLLKF